MMHLVSSTERRDTGLIRTQCRAPLCAVIDYDLLFYVWMSTFISEWFLLTTVACDEWMWRET